jgi:hypothetical protein
MTVDAREVCKHSGDCSVWSVPPAGEPCKICDCGALRKAILNADKSPDNDDLWEAWAQHLRAIDRSMRLL